MNINRNSKNVELQAIPAVKEILDAKGIVVVDVIETSNGDYTSLYLAQVVETGAGSTVSAAQAMLLGWDASIARCITNAATSKVEALGIKPGDNLNEKFGVKFAIQVVDSNTPPEEWPDCPQRATNDGELLIDRENGKPIYRYNEIVLAEDLNHQIIRATPESQYERSSTTVKASKILEKEVKA